MVDYSKLLLAPGGPRGAGGYIYIYICIHINQCFLFGFRVPEGTPAGGNTGPRWYLAVRGCPTSRVHSTNPKGSFGKMEKRIHIPREDKKEGKREDGRLDFSLRLVAPGGPADLVQSLYTFLVHICFVLVALVPT